MDTKKASDLVNAKSVMEKQPEEKQPAGKAGAPPTRGDDKQALLQMILGFRITQIIYVAAKLGLADCLSSGPKTASELALLTHTHAPSLYRLMRALAGLGIFQEDERGRFAQTPRSDLLRSESENSLRDLALFFARPAHWAATGDLLNCVQSGTNAYDHLYGMSIWAYNQSHPEDNEASNAFFSSATLNQIEGLEDVIDFSGSRVVMDAGGGQGKWIATVLKRNPHLRGILFDQPHVIDRARAVLEQSGVAERCETVSGDFFAGIPQGADTLMLKDVLHDWSDDEALAILRNCRQALPETGRLLVIDSIIQPGNDFHPRKLTDIEMLISASGRERTEPEWQALFSQAGFALKGVAPTRTAFHVIEGRPVPASM